MDNYEMAWWHGYGLSHDLAAKLRKLARNSVEMRQMAEGVNDLLLQHADDIEESERKAS